MDEQKKETLGRRGDEWDASCNEGSSLSIGLALSGGGFRASAFHLGVLKRLEEIGILERISILSTVSGGSIIGALYALRCVQQGDGRPGMYPVEDLIEEVRGVVTRNFRRRALFGSLRRGARAAASFFTRKVRRMPLLVKELDHTLFREANLGKLPSWILINATNLATGKCWKFFHDRAGDYLVGATDQTGEIHVAEAVGASAAYPVLTDPYPFKSRWELFRSSLLDERWMRPTQRRPGDVSAWRRRHGKAEGSLTLPLVDGGVYDNEGLNGLRSAQVDHAIYACAAGPTGSYQSGRWDDLERTISVMHGRLGAVTRQHAHEMTHRVEPKKARRKLLSVAEKLRTLRRSASGEATKGGASAHDELQKHADALEEISDVGWPPRGTQYQTITPLLLRRARLARNAFAEWDPSYDVPKSDRGLTAPLVRELSRVRTDLDAHRPRVVDLLIAQGYFLTDAHAKVSMPKVVAAATGESDVRHGTTPSWPWAHEVVERANANQESTAQLLKKASERKPLLGRSASSK